MRTSEQAAARPSKLPLRPQDEVECRRCEVHCDKVVYPAACAENGCPFLYAYEEFGHTYVGCMQKVFEVEIDLDCCSRRNPARRLRRSPGDEPATAALPGGGRELLRKPDGRARLPQSRVPRAARRRAELPDLAQIRASESP
jgi:hypothetical protein